MTGDGRGPGGPVDLLWSFRTAAGEEGSRAAFGVPCALIVYAVPAPAGAEPWPFSRIRYARTPVHAPSREDLVFLVAASLRLAMRAGALGDVLQRAGIPLALPADGGVRRLTPWGLPPGVGPFGFPLREATA